MGQVAHSMVYPTVTAPFNMVLTYTNAGTLIQCICNTYKQLLALWLTNR
jgi:hypothetical protein